MAVNMPPSPVGRQDLRPPNLPPVLHTRSGNEMYERPHTPTRHGFTSPAQTPQGSPSKNRMPPGATNLPSVFEHAMKLTPSSPAKFTSNVPSFPSGKGGIFPTENLGSFNESVIHKDSGSPGSPTRISNKENNSPGGLRLGRDPVQNVNQAAMSRQEPYQTRDHLEVSKRKSQAQLRGLTAEELEKLQLPKVKRLANVTQLC